MVHRKKLKQIRLHSEGTETLLLGALILLILNGLLYALLPEGWSVLFYSVLAVSIAVYLVVVNFFRCPIRVFEEETENTVVAAADGKVVVVEEVEEMDYFRDRRIMVSIFMSPFNVHANWFPVEGTVKKVAHHDGNFHKAWLPKASTENERSEILIATPSGHEVLVKQIAGAMARRIVTYAREEDDCYIDEHLGFIKFGSRVDVFLPLDTEIQVELGQVTRGNQTVIGRLRPVSSSSEK